MKAYKVKQIRYKLFIIIELDDNMFINQLTFDTSIKTIKERESCGGKKLYNNDNYSDGDNNNYNCDSNNNISDY